MRVWIPVAALLLLPTAAVASEADLKQTLSDLSAQVDDKQRLDTERAVNVELSQTRGWLSEAGNAIKEEKEALARQLFERVRAQLKLLDQRIALSQLQAELGRLEKGLNGARRGLQSAKKQLEEKRVQLKALQMAQTK